MNIKGLFPTKESVVRPTPPPSPFRQVSPRKNTLPLTGIPSAEYLAENTQGPLTDSLTDSIFLNDRLGYRDTLDKQIQNRQFVPGNIFDWAIRYSDAMGERNALNSRKVTFPPNLDRRRF